VSDELKPCPFCGSEKVHIVYCNEAYGVCDSCGARGKSYPDEYGHIAESIDREWAVKSWNTRPLEDALRANIDELEKQLQSYKDFCSAIEREE
jgi:Lar family restriction alleviation protein